MREKRRVSLTLKVYAELILPVDNDEEAEDIINGMDISDLIQPIGGLEISDGIIEIEDFDTEYEGEY